MTQSSPLDLLLKYNGQVPRYTSYPPAPHFIQDPEKMGWRDMLIASNWDGPKNASIYFHVPFCPKRCLFCGCHTEIGRGLVFMNKYMDTLLQDLSQTLLYIEPTRPITQIHFGGGTPNAVPYVHLKNLLDLLRSRMQLVPGAEVAIECDPNLVTLEKLGELAAMGFNRVSFGIQDFNLQVLDAVNRRFPKVPPRDLFRVARELGFAGNNLDLIYGLPYQTQDSFRDSVQKAIDAGPDRISLFPYAHVPWIKGHQNKIGVLPMPDAHTRLLIALESRETLVKAGYEAIGMDHFARHGDELALAKAKGTLHRNFQGYCPGERAGQVYGFGASAITQLHQGYLQNTKDLAKYESMVKEGKPSFELGYKMRPVDIAVRAIINGVLCSGEADLKEHVSSPDIDAAWAAEYLAEVPDKLRPFLEDGLISYVDGKIHLTEDGFYVARSVAGALDPMLQVAKTEGPRYSQAL